MFSVIFRFRCDPQLYTGSNSLCSYNMSGIVRAATDQKLCIGQTSQTYNRIQSVLQYIVHVNGQRKFYVKQT